MSIRKGLLASMGAAVAALSMASTASAVPPPRFSDCPRSSISVNGGTCVDIQSTGGHLTIKGFQVPIGESLEIRGGVGFTATGTQFYGATGTNGFFARPIEVPGGLLGIDFPIPGNRVTATARLVGPASAINVDLNTFSVSLPIKLELRNPLIGPLCQIASSSNPVRLSLIIGTTSPPPPNRPISGAFGSVVVPPDSSYVSFVRMVNVDNSFAIPGANSCGLGLHLIDALVNAKLGLPSAAGNNEMVVENNVSLQAP